MFRFFQSNTEAKTQEVSNSFRVSTAGRISLTSEGAVFLHVESGLVFRANPIGARIWKGILDGRNQEAIVHEISREYDTPLEQVAQDTARFVAELRSSGFLAGDSGSRGAAASCS